MQKTEFTVKVGEEDKKFAVRLPDGKLRKKAREVKADYFRKNALKDTTIYQHQIQDLLKKKGLWSDEKEEEIKTVTRQIEDKLRLLSKGRSVEVPDTNKLREVVIKEVKPLRNKQLELLGERSQLDGLSIQSESEQVEFDFLLSESLYDELDERVFKSLEDYQTRTDEPFCEEAGRKLAELMGMSNPKWFEELPENKLLIKHKFLNTDGRYTDKDNNLVNAEGKRVDKDGYLLNEEGKRVDEYNNLLDDKGEIVGYVPFDDETPVVPTVAEAPTS